MKTIRTLLFEYLQEQIEKITAESSPLYGWQITPTDKDAADGKFNGLVQLTPSTSRFVPFNGAMVEFDFSCAVLCKSPVDTKPSATSDKWTIAADKATLAAAEIILLIEKAFAQTINTVKGVAMCNAMCHYTAGYIVTHFDDPNSKQSGRADFTIEAPGTRGILDE